MQGELVRPRSYARSILAILALVVSGLIVLAAASPALALDTAVFSAATPGAGATVLAKPTSLAVTADDAAPIFGATVTLNGASASFVNVDYPIGHSAYDPDNEEWYWSIDDFTVARITGYFASGQTLTGSNVVVTRVNSALGTSTNTRSFTYGSATAVSAVSPADGAVLPTSPTAISVALTSGSTGFATSSMTLDGLVVPTAYTAATKTFTHTPASSLSPGTHNVVFTARDLQGGTVSKTWSFRVSPPMSNDAECTACHTTFPDAHAVAGCEDCHTHGYTVRGGSHGSVTPTAAGCIAEGCHQFDHTGDAGWGAGPFSCAFCHSATYPNVPRHTDAQTTAAHVSSTDLTDCVSCHSTSLIEGHGKYPTDAAIKYQCTECHGPGARQQVKDAIAAGNTACTACHGAVHAGVTADFAKASSHTLGDADVSHVQDIPLLASFQTLYSDFLGAPTRVNTQVINLAGGEVKLAQDLSGAVDPGAQSGLIIASAGATTTVDQYKPADNAWNGANSALFTPAVRSARAVGTGASSFKIPGVNSVFVTNAGVVYQYNPPSNPTADSWTTSSTLAPSSTSANAGTGADTAVNTTGTTSTGQCVYFSRNGSANIYYRGYQGSGTAGSSFTFSGGNLGQGSALAFSAQANRLFVINKASSASGNGNLYYATGARGTTTFTMDGQVTQGTTGTAVWNRATVANTGGTDYLYILGTGTDGVLGFKVISNLSGTPAISAQLPAPAGWTLGDGCDLEYSNGYLYAIQGGSATGFARIQVPATPTVAASWGAWQNLATLRNWAAGSSISFADAAPLPVASFKYFGSGTFGGQDILPAAGSVKWSKAYWDATLPPSTGVSVKAQGFDGAAWQDLASSSASPMDLSAFTVAAFPKIRLVATLTSSDITNVLATPSLNSWGVDSATTKTVVDAAMLSCQACHGVVTAATGSDYCLRCHTGTLDEPFTASSPYKVAFRTVLSPFFTGWSKTVAGMDFASSAHGTAAGNRDVSALSQDLATEFLPDALNQVQITATGGGDSRLATDTSGGSNPAAQTGLVFASAGGLTNFDQYKPTDNAWNGANSAIFTPAVKPAATASGASSFSYGGKIYVATGSNAYVYTPSADPAADSWVSNSNFAGSSIGAGGDTALSAAKIFYLRAGTSSNNRVYYKALPSGSGTSNYFTTTGVAHATTFGAGAAMAYSSQTGRLFFVNKNAATNASGTLDYLPNPDSFASGNAPISVGPQVTPSGTTQVFNRMTSVNVAGTDYLFILGPNTAGITTLQVASNLGGVPVVIDTAEIDPFGAGAPLADGCDLEYNATDGYLYAIRGGGNAGFVRIKVPTDPTVPANWGAWETLLTGRNWAAGSSLAFADADPAYQVPFKYFGAGTIATPEIAAAYGATSWQAVTFSATTPASTTFSVKVEGYDGSSWSTLVPAAITSPIDLSAVSTSTYSKLRLTATLSTSDITNVAATPVLDKWSVIAVAPSSAYLPTCQNCHTQHGSNNENLIAYTSKDGSIVKDDSAAEAGAGLCFKCHGTGAGAGKDVQTPDSMTYGHPIAASATKHSDREAATDLNVLGSRHADCSDCHNAHSAKDGLHTVGSSNAGPTLTGVVGVKVTTWPDNWGTLVASDFKPELLNGEATDMEAFLCLKCHSMSGGALPTVTTASGTYQMTDLAQEFNPNNASTHNVTGQSTGMKTSFTVSGSTVTWPLPTVNMFKAGWNANSKMTCTDCHGGGTVSTAAGPHGSSAKWMIDPAYSTDYTTASLSNTSGQNMPATLICAKCHDASTLLSSNTGHSGDGSHRTLCIRCHIAVPHGWKRPRMLISGSDAAPYKFSTNTSGNSLTGFAASNRSSASGWSTNQCGGCGEHNVSGTQWP